MKNHLELQSFNNTMQIKFLQKLHEVNKLLNWNQVNSIVE